MIEHRTRTGESKIVENCCDLLTGVRYVGRIYTDLAVIDVIGDDLAVREIVSVFSFQELQRMTAAPLRPR
ncbi:hypothetical protein AYR66_18505 [Noviherbaspirillum denitrificans]|uniref:Uncharacterized protein n=2 Tax=Noviherbaspirillum denitrificans TaxID=1968433 RepID=A0A254TEV7_9BURK|nr:hypothetical protein AYR66_18505 [Noviherbaspirillum denitrificans]